MFQNIFGCRKTNKKLSSQVKEKVDEYPEPSKYRISTMTMITSFNCNINLEVVSIF